MCLVGEKMGAIWKDQVRAGRRTNRHGCYVEGIGRELRPQHHHHAARDEINNLAALAELVILVETTRPGFTLFEAAACYRLGAYRSAIVATWIAVCYDIIGGALAGGGDKR